MDLAEAVARVIRANVVFVAVGIRLGSRIKLEGHADLERREVELSRHQLADRAVREAVLPNQN